MKPAAPVTRIPCRASALGAALGQVGGEAVLPRGQLDRVLALAGQRRVGGAGRRPAEHLGGRRHHLALDLRLLEDFARELVPGAGAGSGHVVDAVLDPLDQPDDAIGEVPGVGRRADLVADDQHLALVAARRSIVSTKFAAGAEQPGRADDEVALVGRRGRLLAGQLGAAVGRERPRRSVST